MIKYIDSSTNTMVILDGKHVGNIIKSGTTLYPLWCYQTKDTKQKGEYFDSIDKVKQSLK